MAGFGWCGVGICYRNIVQKNNYTFNGRNDSNVGELNNGAYLLNCAGYVYSHSVEKENYRQVTKIEFRRTGAQVDVKMDPFTGLLAFWVDG